MLSQALVTVEALISQWQEALGNSVQVLLGGSLVSGLFVFDDETQVIDVDVRFLVENPEDELLRQRIEQVTSLRYRKTIPVSDWPSGQSVGVMVEGILEIPGLTLPLEVEGCIRNPRYVGWARFYTLVLTEEELAKIRQRKAELRNDKKVYKAYKESIRQEVQRRVLEQNLLT
jgi:hypothetical protein